MRGRVVTWIETELDRRIRTGDRGGETGRKEGEDAEPTVVVTGSMENRT